MPPTEHTARRRCKPREVEAAAESPSAPEPKPAFPQELYRAVYDFLRHSARLKKTARAFREEAKGRFDHGAKTSANKTLPRLWKTIDVEPDENSRANGGTDKRRRNSDTPDDRGSDRSKRRKLRKVPDEDGGDAAKRCEVNGVLDVDGSNIDKGQNVEDAVTPVKHTPTPKKTRTPNARFQRIKDEEVTFLDDRLKDNTFMAKPNALGSFGHKAHEDLIVTRGKGFTKEKNKKKKGSYRGGKIDFTSNSVKFDSD